MWNQISKNSSQHLVKQFWHPVFTLSACLSYKDQGVKSHLRHLFEVHSCPSPSGMPSARCVRVGAEVPAHCLGCSDLQMCLPPPEEGASSSAPLGECHSLLLLAN